MNENPLEINNTLPVDNDSIVAEFSIEEPSLNEDDFFAVHEEVFKSGIPLLVDETFEEYRERVDGLWIERYQQLSQERQGGNKKAIESEESPEPVSDEVSVSLTQSEMQEYAHRYQAGESIVDLLQGQAHFEEKSQAIELLAVSLDSEESEEQVTQEQTPVINEEQQNQTLYELMPVEDRERLPAWPASYELAKIAHNEGVDLTTLSREQYADYAIENGLIIDDGQLRASVWQRMNTSPEDIIAQRKEIESLIPESQHKAFDRFSMEMKQLADSENRYLQEGVRVRQGTKDSGSWLFFGINGSLTEKMNETHKGYLTFNDLGTFSSDRFLEFLGVLQEAGYNGDVKTFQDLGHQAVLLNDQIVMHGATFEDVELANNLAQQFFGEELSDIVIGKDEVIDGKNQSYSQVLAAKIKQEIQGRRQLDKNASNKTV